VGKGGREADAILAVIVALEAAESRCRRHVEARFWSLVQIPTQIQFVFANFQVTVILAIST
jgi:hypothetical protein